jgi:hypothetical protein
LSSKSSNFVSAGPLPPVYALFEIFFSGVRFLGAMFPRLF